MGAHPGQLESVEHVRRLVLDDLEGGDGPVELDPDLGVLDGQMQRPLRRPHQLGRDGHGQVVEDPGPQRRLVAWGSHPPGPATVEGEPGHFPGHVEGGHRLTTGPTGRVVEDESGRHRARRGPPPGPSRPTPRRGRPAWSRPGRIPGPAARGGQGPGFDGGQGGAVARFLHRRRPPAPARGQIAQEVVGPQTDGGQGGQDGRGEKGPREGQGPELLLEDDQVDQPEAEAPGRCGDEHPQPAQVGHRRPQGRGHSGGVFDHGPDVGRRRLGRQGGPDGLTEIVLFGRKGEVHGGVGPWLTLGPASRAAR